MGGPVLACEIVKAAQQMGVYTIVTDWYTEEKSPAKRIADEYAMVSTADVDEIVGLVKNNNVDGVLTGFLDSSLPYYQQVCSKLNYPCYITAEQVDITTNKVKFKELCKFFNVPVVDEFYTGSNLNDKILNKIKYPVLIKPADNSGGRGIFICNDEKELKENFKVALSFSESNTVIIERYMTGKEVSIFYTFRNGEIYLTLMGDRHTKKNQSKVIALPVAYTFPSEHLKYYLKTTDSNVRKMFEFIGIKDGLVFIQSFVENNECVFYEMGFRLTGSLEYKISEKINRINPLKMMIAYALTGEMNYSNTLKHNNPNHDLKACNITFLSKPGKIGKIIGIEETLSIPGVIDVVQSYNEDNTIPEEAKGTLKQVVIRVFAVTKTEQDLAEVMRKAYKYINVLSPNNESMLLEGFDYTNF